MSRDLSELSHDERLAQDDQYRERWEAALVRPFNPERTSDDHTIHDAIWLRAQITEAGDRKTAEVLRAASREIARLEAQVTVLRSQERLMVAVAKMAKDRPLPEGGAK
jgi:cob(I)alamin adenosyltransferase